MTKRNRKLLRDKRAVSPVIATVVLVAVTIVVAVAVAYWMGGIAGLYTRFEQLKVQSYNAPQVTFTDPPYPWNGDGWNVTIVVKNTGTADATIDQVLINGKAGDAYNQVNVTQGNGLSVPIGKSVTVFIGILKDGELPPNEEGFTPGTSIEVKLRSAAGMDYTQLLTLP